MAGTPTNTSWSKHSAAWLIAAALGFAGCTGSAESTPNDVALGTGGWGAAGNGAVGGFAGNAGASGVGGGGQGGDGQGGGTPSINALQCEVPGVGPSPLRRLTHDEYDNAVHDLLGDTTRPASAFAPDTQVGLFDNTATTQTVAVLLADQYVEAAVRLAEDIPSVSTLVGCEPNLGASCVRGFIERFGRRAYRRPLASAETDALITIFEDTRTLSDARTGVRAMVAAVLTSPNFLFKPEGLGAPSTLPNAQALTPFELAARLASLMWASVPDDMLLDAAQNGQLETRQQVADQARRMLDDERSHDAQRRFYEQWLGLPLLDSATKDNAIYPQFNAALRDAMREETRRFIDHVLWQADGRLNTLLTAPYSFINGSLAELYGAPAPSDPSAFVQTNLDTTQRAGVLSHASLMTTFAAPGGSSPIKRGKLVRVRMLCQDLPDPPPNIPPPPEPMEGLSTRERFAMHTDNAACRGCHDLIDGLGFGLENYDGLGIFRTVDHGVPVDSSGEVTASRDIDGPYVGGPELSAKLAMSSQVRDCVPTQWLRYALGRNETEADTCSLVELRDAFAASDGDLHELMIAITQTDAFWSYRPTN